MALRKWIFGKGKNDKTHAQKHEVKKTENPQFLEKKKREETGPQPTYTVVTNVTKKTHKESHLDERNHETAEVEKPEPPKRHRPRKRKENAETENTAVEKKEPSASAASATASAVPTPEPAAPITSAAPTTETNKPIAKEEQVEIVDINKRLAGKKPRSSRSCCAFFCCRGEEDVPATQAERKPLLPKSLN